MTTCSDSQPSALMSRSEYLSTLPLWRRWLAMFNWRPVYDIEQRSRQHEINAIASENSIRLIENDIEQLKTEISRLAAIESRLDALLLNFDSYSPTQHETGSN